MQNPSIPPDPDAASAADAREEARAQGLIAQIARLSPPVLSFGAYTTMAMLHPRLGYYQGRETIFGRRGDFTTAAQMGAVFATCLARQWSGCLARQREAGRPCAVLEIGPGSGELAHDALCELERLACLPDQYVLYEPSRRLAEAQRRRLAELGQRLPGCALRWVDSLDGVPISGVVFANEVVDALAVEILRRREGRVEQLFVRYRPEDGALVEDWREAAGEWPARLGELEARLGAAFADGYRIEMHEAYEDWMAAVCGCLRDGELWLCDYGYDEAGLYHPQRACGTLQTHHRQRRGGNPLELPGLQDISASVNFTKIDCLATRHGLELLEYCPQGRWLLDRGALELAQAGLDGAASPLDRHRRREQFMQLVSPEAMGEVFKVAAWRRGAPQDP